ncbi:chloride channel protein [Marinibactrum halimedae]|uniref:Chloride channel protein n=1 Tax=Marinibactrum halimedae TaxID=1444977 RepID=A0AA37WM52_9GAMM|nr:chloride channel protein [Marinibactrum halimedae]MCD9460489.1 chloride channel protein [Marinibactrum halimedae]GLS25895.1 chloride channel protein [Marinibactrum halimedae]
MKTHIALYLRNFRHQLAYLDALPQLTFLALLAGVATGTVVVGFRLLVDLPLLSLPEHIDNFEGLPQSARFWLPLFGATALGALLMWLPSRRIKVGVGHVLDRLHNHQGHMPASNFFVQFFGGITCLITGQSVGREGPSVHLGAATASFVGRWLRIPNNSMRTLIGCGVAAGISASFNTPLAGVIFAMEVVMMEYTIAGFIPIIISSVTGAIITRAMFGHDHSFVIAHSQLTSLYEFPFMIVIGIGIGLSATTYSWILRSSLSVAHWPMVIRFAIAGGLTGLTALVFPEILGLGYDTIEDAIAGNFSLQLLLAIALTKLVISSAAIGLGLPGGLIGPTLVIGACLGGAFGIIGQSISGVHSDGLYVLIGMTAMMGAVLNAPLAALVAILELTHNPNVIFPSMMVVVIASLVTRRLFNADGVFLALLSAQGHNIDSNAPRRELSRIGVLSVMNTQFVVSDPVLECDDAHQLLNNQPLWIIFENPETQSLNALRAADLASFLDSAPEKVLTLEESIQLAELPGKRLAIYPIHDTANLLEAHQLMKAHNAEAVYVERSHRPVVGTSIVGIISRDAINNHYKVH